TTMNNPVSVQRTYDALSCRLGAAQIDLIAGIGGGMRNLMTASRLGSATISALPGDSMTAILASKRLVPIAVSSTVAAVRLS
ncbi:hypothetical protein ACDA55_37595, partial [Rhizobium ruizarguesonis]